MPLCSSGRHANRYKISRCRLAAGDFLLASKAFGKASLGLRTTGKAADMLDGETTGHAVEVSHYIRAMNAVGGAVMVGIFTYRCGYYAVLWWLLPPQVGADYIRAVNAVGGAVMASIFTDCDGRFASLWRLLPPQVDADYIRAMNAVGGAVMVGIFTCRGGCYAAPVACMPLDRSVKPFSTKITAPACVAYTSRGGFLLYIGTHRRFRWRNNRTKRKKLLPPMARGAKGANDLFVDTGKNDADHSVSAIHRNVQSQCAVRVQG